MDTVSLHWNNSPFYANAANNISTKMKQVRQGLRNWSKNLSKLNTHLQLQLGSFTHGWVGGSKTFVKVGISLQEASEISSFYFARI